MVAVVVKSSLIQVKNTHITGKNHGENHPKSLDLILDRSGQIRKTVN